MLDMMPLPNASKLFPFEHSGEERFASDLERRPPEDHNPEDSADA